MHTPAIRRSFNDRGSHNLSDMFVKARKGNTRPKWLGENVWKELLLIWGGEAFLKKSAQAKANRASERGSSVHRGGNISSGEHRDRMVNFINFC